MTSSNQESQNSNNNSKPLGLGKRKAEPLEDAPEENGHDAVDIYIPENEQYNDDDDDAKSCDEGTEEWKSVISMYRHAQRLIMLAHGDLTGTKDKSNHEEEGEGEEEEKAQALFRGIVHECDRLVKSKGPDFAKKAEFYFVFGGALVWLSILEERPSSDREIAAAYSINDEYLQEALDKLEAGLDEFPKDEELVLTWSICKIAAGEAIPLPWLHLQMPNNSWIVFPWVRFLIMAGMMPVAPEATKEMTDMLEENQTTHPLLYCSWLAAICEVALDEGDGEEEVKRLSQLSNKLWQSLANHQANKDIEGFSRAKKNFLMLQSRCCLYLGSVAEYQENDDDDDDDNNNNNQGGNDDDNEEEQRSVTSESARKWYQQAQEIWKQLEEQFKIPTPDYITKLLD